MARASGPNPCVLSGELDSYPCLEEGAFRLRIGTLRANGHRLLSYFASPDPHPGAHVVNAAFVQEAEGNLVLLRSRLRVADSHRSLTEEFPEFHCFERELAEQHGLRFTGHPWLKPLRFPGARQKTPRDYPFFSLEGKEVHETGVGPIHAGVIEPGHFRFMCFGETIHHLEIQLGYQHRGVEPLLLQGDAGRLGPLVETISGDSSVAHAIVYAQAFERLCGHYASDEQERVRGIALELERIAMHLAGLAGMATDIAFLPGGSTYGRLRTTIINTSMLLCGSRFGRGWVRPGEIRGTPDPGAIGETIAALKAFGKDFRLINDLFFGARTVRHRLRKTGRISPETARRLGFVGMAARSTGLDLDLRKQLRGAPYWKLPIECPVEPDGDCWARARLRAREATASLSWLLDALAGAPYSPRMSSPLAPPAGNRFALSVVEGWRGEIVHYLETAPSGSLAAYKVQDPSLRNWLALALAARRNEISDFPICNKSFDLSYCGHDL